MKVNEWERKGKEALKTKTDSKQCVDIIFEDPENVAEVNQQNCLNSTDIGFNNVYTTGKVSAAPGATAASVSLLATMLVVSSWLLA